MSRGSGLPEANLSLPRCNHSNTCAGVEAACRSLVAARSRRSGAEVEQLASAAKSNGAARLKLPSNELVFFFMVFLFGFVPLLTDQNFLTRLMPKDAPWTRLAA